MTTTDAAPVRFGLFDWVDANENTSIAEVFEQRLRMLEFADQAGFYCYHQAEHHGTPLSVSPSPNLLLSSAAQRTERLHLGPLVQLLPLYNPLRNLEEVCMLDHLSHGRLELGVGRGISAGELAMYGLDPAEAHGRFEECFDILMQGLHTGNVHHEGRYYNIQAENLPVRPYQQPLPPLWYPTSNVERIPWVAQHGFNTLFGFTMPTLEQTAEQMTRFRDLAEQHAGEPGRYNGHVDKPFYGVTRHIYVAESDEVALDEARVAYTQFDHAFTNRPGETRSGPSRRGDFGTALERGQIIAGSPEKVRKGVQTFIDGTGTNYFVGTFAYGYQTDAQVLRSLGLFAQEVMPAISPSTIGA
jgi:alkanesulfonate monooxygenase SsuD/methylene tetrahydromethanopterin reductase-like flavin-dependent oxidoreductase (luciferase family)